MEEKISGVHNNIPTILVIFGATGDLARRKLIPALFNLFASGLLPQRFKILGFARRTFDDREFQGHVSKVLCEDHNLQEKDIGSFLALFAYKQGDFRRKSDYLKLTGALGHIDDAWRVCTNKLFYIAATPEFYKKIFLHLYTSGLAKPCSPEEGWTRVIVEKPFGKDLKTAKVLDEILEKLFQEVQIYRIDHYLAKEMLQNILAFRFSNSLFEENWNKDTIERIDIRLWERLGVEGRGSFYDGVGSLRDVGQNHLLQMLALVSMDRPQNLRSDSIRAKRAEILKMLKISSLDEIKMFSARAQYEGYRTIPGVRAGSQTETYFRTVAFLQSPRWEGVPIMLESGKRLAEQRKEVVVTFRHPRPCLCPAGRHYQNKVVFALEPEERITIHFWSKKPGLMLEMEERRFEFLLRQKKSRVQYVEEYGKLLLDCIVGDQTLFVSTEEIRAMWRFIDPIVEVWKWGIVPLEIYKADTAEIAEAAERRRATWDIKKRIRKEIGVIGLGKMGSNLLVRLRERGWSAAAYDPDEEARNRAINNGNDIVGSIRQLVGKFSRPRLLWLMAPHTAVDAILGELAPYLSRGDVIIDGGNSFYRDSIGRGNKLLRSGIHFLDVGVSGGPEGARHGAALMVGGNKEMFEKYEELFRDLAQNQGYSYVGELGAGHFVKMVHNGIEYGAMQSLAEGFTILKRSPFKLDLKKVAGVYNHGSVIESRLVGWLAEAFNVWGDNLLKVSGSVGHTGEGAWTVATTKKLHIPAPIIESALKFRIKSRRSPSYTGKILTALRSRFGGHPVRNSKFKNQK